MYNPAVEIGGGKDGRDGDFDGGCPSGSEGILPIRNNTC